MALSKLIFVSCVTAVCCQLGRGQRNDMASGGANDLDRAMDGWAQLSQQPDKLQEVFASFKDPEVMAKAQEMMKDPDYMRAAKRKVAELQAKAQAKGMLDGAGNPVPGAATNAALGQMGGGGGADVSNAREWELENAEAYANGELTDAEMGMRGMKQAMKDPSVLADMMKLMQDPESMAQVKKMMSDPTFQVQAQRMAEQMKASGEMPDFSGAAQKAAQLMGKMGGGGADATEMARLRRENAALKQHLRSEL